MTVLKQVLASKPSHPKRKNISGSLRLLSPSEIASFRQESREIPVWAKKQREKGASVGSPSDLKASTERREKPKGD